MNQKTIGVLEDDMADVAAARMALRDTEALMLKWTRKPRVSTDDIDRMSRNVRVLTLGLATTGKWLRERRRA